MKKALIFLLLPLTACTNYKQISGRYTTAYQKDKSIYGEITLKEDSTATKRTISTISITGNGSWTIKNKRIIIIMNYDNGFGTDTIISKIKGQKMFFYLNNTKAKFYLKKDKNQGEGACEVIKP